MAKIKINISGDEDVLVRVLAAANRAIAKQADRSKSEVVCDLKTSSETDAFLKALANMRSCEMSDDIVEQARRRANLFRTTSIIEPKKH